MLSLQSVCSAPSTKALQFSPITIPYSVVKILRARCYATADKSGEPIANFAGIQLEETVDTKAGKLRLDSWISSRIVGISRARVQSSIRSGLVNINGQVVNKVSHNVKPGDKVNCTISESQPLRAEPEAIPLDIVYEDENVLVVNKPAHMVVHPAPGNATGTLVNGILHHCSLPNVAFSNQEVLSDAEDISDNEKLDSSIYGASVRPGIVHRLDKGTSGLLVVAKNEHSHAHLSEQFKLHTIQRVYISLTSGAPSQSSGRVEVPIGRDPNNRIRMTAIHMSNKHGQARHAASRYKVIEILAGGGSALVEWRLETGRTHQIRAHAKYMGIPLLGDEVYGGTKNMAMSLLQPRTSPSCHQKLLKLVSGLERPCLHAFTLGFIHPHTGEKIHFSRPPPPDFAEILSQLREFGSKKFSPSNLRELLLQSCMDDAQDIRQSVFALLGDLAQVCPGYLHQKLSEFLSKAAKQLCTPELKESIPVANNACWAIGELAVKVRQDVSPIVMTLILCLVPILQSAQITCGKQCHYSWKGCFGVSRDCVTPCRAFYATMVYCFIQVRANPSGYSNSLVYICKAIASCHVIRSEALQNEVCQVLHGYKQMLGDGAWEQYLSALEPKSWKSCQNTGYCIKTRS